MPSSVLHYGDNSTQTSGIKNSRQSKAIGTYCIHGWDSLAFVNKQKARSMLTFGKGYQLQMFS